MLKLVKTPLWELLIHSVREESFETSEMLGCSWLVAINTTASVWRSVSYDFHVYLHGFCMVISKVMFVIVTKNYGNFEGRKYENDSLELPGLIKTKKKTCSVGNIQLYLQIPVRT